MRPSSAFPRKIMSAQTSTNSAASLEVKSQRGLAASSPPGCAVQRTAAEPSASRNHKDLLMPVAWLEKVSSFTRITPRKSNPAARDAM